MSISSCDFDMIASSWSVEQRALGPWLEPRAQGSGLIAHGSVAMGQGSLARGQSAEVRSQESEFMASWVYLQAMDFEFELQKHSHMLMNIMKLQKSHF